MEQKMISIDKAEYDNKRFPKKWQAMLGCAIMQMFANAAVIVIMILLGVDYAQKFTSEFGANMFLGIISQFCAVLIIPLIILAAFRKDFFATVRMKKAINPLQILLLVITSIGVFFAAQAINSTFVMQLDSIFGTHSDASNLKEAGSISQLIFEIFVVAMLPAMCEEIFFRGMVMRSFERSSKAGAVVISSVTFSIMHGNATQFVYALIIGGIVGTVTMISDSLFAGATVHFTLNLFSAILSYPPVYAVYKQIAEPNQYLYYIVAIRILPFIGFISLAAFIIYTLKRNEKKYGAKIVSEMDNVSLMAKENAGEKVALIICWVFFAVVNLLSAVITWKGSL